MYRVYFFLSLVYLSRAQIPSFGFCPDYLPMTHFDMTRFLGKWYEAERYFQFSEVAARCVVTDYAMGPNGKIYVSNEVTNRFTGVKRVIGGNLDLSGKKTEGRLVVKYDTTPISTTTALTVLDTDYDNYAVIWSCNGLGPVNAQSAWLMTRERIPDSATLQIAYGVLDRYKISRTFFVKMDQEGCAIAASDLNAALGIASTSTNVEQTSDIDGKTVRESTNVKAQLVPEVLFKSSKEKESVGKKELPAKSSVEVPKSAESVPDEPILREKMYGNSEETAESVNKNLSVRKLPVSISESVHDVIKSEDVPSNTMGGEKKDGSETDTAINEADEKNNDLLATV